MTVISKDHRYCTHHWNMLKRVRGTHCLSWDERENMQKRVHHNHMHHNAAIEVVHAWGCITHSLLCYVFPLVKRRESTAVSSKDH